LLNFTIITTDKKLPAASTSTPESGKDLADPAVTYDRGGRRRLPDRRRFTHLPHFPERRSLRFRRSDFDRRQRLDGTSPTGFERRRIVESTRRQWISRNPKYVRHRQFVPENETAYRAIAITYMQSAQRFASGKLYVTAIDVWGTPTCDACPIRLQLKISA